ncbi:MAG: M23 family metallopeptidase [Candidatus Wallbacteria bacterium]|nr:M23 family metallopeptidase [Candidatus Wallbacteria bacterium]
MSDRRGSSGRASASALLCTALAIAALATAALHATPFDPVAGLSADTERKSGGERYEVVSGDSLWAIAERFLGDGSRWRDIFDANRQQIDNPNLIFPGQRFLVPGGSDVSSDGARPKAPGDTSGRTGGREGHGRVEGFDRLPLDHSRISSPFGPRQSPCPGCSSFHKGIDLSASRGTPVYAVGSGRCVQASFEEGGGNTVVIDHGRGYKSYYLHLQHGSFKVRPGTDVRSGQHIANVNNTGAYTTGDHLHFAISHNGVLIDPQNVIHVPQSF